jgi:hypothetical protein
MIPNSSVTTDNTGQQLTLNIDLSTLSPPSFLQFQSFTIGGCTTTTPPIPSSGVVALTWNKTHVSWTRVEGHALNRIGDFVIHSQGTSVFFSATVQGSAFGEAVTGGILFSNIGENRGVSMEVQRGQ